MEALQVDQNTTVDSCDFCGIAERPSFPWDVTEPMDPNGDLLLKPSRGMLINGHFLVIPTAHGTSMASSSLELGAVEETIGRYADFLSEKFGPYVWVEHGSDGLEDADKPGSGACMIHTHLHLVPATLMGQGDLGEIIQGQLTSWQTLDRFEDIAAYRGSPYIFLRRYLGSRATQQALEGRSKWADYVAPDPQLRGQFVQRMAAQLVDKVTCADQPVKLFDQIDSDWATNRYGIFEICQTYTALGCGPGWTSRGSRWFCNHETEEFGLGEKRNLPGATDEKELRTWKLGVPGAPGSWADLERAKSAA